MKSQLARNLNLGIFAIVTSIVAVACGETASSQTPNDSPDATTDTGANLGDAGKDAQADVSDAQTEVPADTQSADTQSADTQSADTQSADTQSADTQSDVAADSQFDVSADVQTDVAADTQADATTDTQNDVVSDVKLDSWADAAPDGGEACTYAGAACPTNFYCDAPDCKVGTCKPIPKTETQNRVPVCGCDKVTYWNSSVAASHGASVASAGECSAGKMCGGFAGTACPTGSNCAYHLKDKASCNISDLPGTCWGLPAICPNIVIGPTSRACGGAACNDECSLIRAQKTWYTDNTCPQ